MQRRKNTKEPSTQAEAGTVHPKSSPAALRSQPSPQPGSFAESALHPARHQAPPRKCTPKPELALWPAAPYRILSGRRSSRPTEPSLNGSLHSRFSKLQNDRNRVPHSCFCMSILNFNVFSTRRNRKSNCRFVQE